MNSDFFYRPLWQQHLLIGLLFLMLFLFSYFYFIADIQNDAQQQQQIYQDKLLEIELLQNRLNRYMADDQSLLTLISEDELANLFAHHQLALQTFKYSEADDVIHWDIELQGQYADFMALMNAFIEVRYYLNFQNLSIHKKQDRQLFFKFELLVEKGKIKKGK